MNDSCPLAKWAKKTADSVLLRRQGFLGAGKRANLCGSLVLSLAVYFALIPSFVCAGQEKQHKADMPGMQMSGDEDMRDMGPSMAAMAGHMYITPLRKKQSGDEEKAKAVVAALKSAIERYKDYRKALADGYVIGNPKLKQSQYHFRSETNTRLADLGFDPTKPTALL